MPLRRDFLNKLNTGPITLENKKIPSRKAPNSSVVRPIRIRALSGPRPPAVWLSPYSL